MFKINYIGALLLSCMVASVNAVNKYPQKISLQDGMKEIGYTRYMNADFESIYLPNSIEVIHKGAFKNCQNLKGGHIKPSQQDYPPLSLPTKLRSIAQETFYGCISLMAIIIPDSVQSILSKAFKNCSSLVSVQANCVSNIGSEAFSMCSSLSSVSFPACTTISENAFYGCALTYINFPNITKTNNIGNNCFTIKKGLFQKAAKPNTVIFGCTLSSSDKKRIGIGHKS